MFEDKDGKAFRMEGCNILGENVHVYSGLNEHIRFEVKMTRFLKVFCLECQQSFGEKVAIF